MEAAVTDELLDGEEGDRVKLTCTGGCTGGGGEAAGQGRGRVLVDGGPGGEAGLDEVGVGGVFRRALDDPRRPIAGTERLLAGKGGLERMEDLVGDDLRLVDPASSTVVGEGPALVAGEDGDLIAVGDAN